MAAMKATSFSTPTHVMALTHPFITPAHRRAMGLPYVLDAYSRDWIGCDFWRMKNEGIINTKWGIFLGNVGHGKSAAMKLLILRLLMMSAGYGEMHAVINDYKSEGNDSEYGKLSEVTQSVVFRLASMQFNPFETRLYIDRNKELNILGILNMAELLAEFGKRDFLASDESVALSIAMYYMIEMPEETWEPGLVEKLTRSLTDDQIKDYYRKVDTSLRNRLFARADLLKDNRELYEETMQKIRLYTNAADNFSPAEIQAAGSRVSFYLHTLLYGKTGSIFGSSHSLYELYTQRTSTRDWRNLTFDAETLLRTMDNIIRLTAIENDRQDLIPDLNADDEMHRPMENLVFAKSNAYLSEVARSTKTLYLSATHRLASIRKGGVGSDKYGYGETIINNLGFAMLGKQQKDAVALNELAERYRLTTANKNGLTSLPPRFFVMVLGEKEPPRLVQTFATPSELQILPTNQMNDYMLDRPDPFNESDIKRFAEENGFDYIPPSENLVPA